MQKTSMAIMKLSTFIVFVFMLVMSNGSSVDAQKTTSLSVSPAIIEIAAQPGRTITRDVTITNTSANAIPISIAFSGITLEDELLAGVDTARFDISEWMSTDEDIVVFNANESKTISIRIAVPRDVIPGGNYGGVAFRALALEGATQDLVNESLPEISVPILLTAPGPQTEEIVIIGSNIFPTAQFSDTLQVRFAVENRGTTHSIIAPQIVISSDGQEMRRENLQASVILPGSKKIVQDTVTQISPGSYSARVELTFGSPTQVLTTPQETLYVVPAVWKLFVVGLVGYAGAYIFSHRKNLHKAIWALTK